MSLGWSFVEKVQVVGLSSLAIPWLVREAGCLAEGAVSFRVVLARRSGFHIRP